MALVVFARTWRVVRVIRSVLDAEGEVHRPGPQGHRPGPGVPPHPCLVPQPSGYHNVLAPGVRARVRHWMRHRRFHQCVLGLVAADLALTAAALGVTVTHCQLEHVPEVGGGMCVAHCRVAALPHRCTAALPHCCTICRFTEQPLLGSRAHPCFALRGRWWSTP